MDPDTLRWAIGILVTVNTVLLGFIGNALWAHVVKCGHVSAQNAGVAKDVERMKEDIGTHDSGMRGDLHRTSTMCTQHELRITLLERSSR